MPPSVPACVGTYERDHPLCNGNPLGETIEERAPCAYRDRCAALQIYCAENNQKPDVVVASLGHTQLATLCEVGIFKHKISQGIAGGPPPAPPPSIPEPEERTKRPTKPPQQRNPRQAIRRAQPLPQESLDLYAHFEQMLRDFFPDRRFGSGKRVLVRPGTFYPIDRTLASRYVSWYCTARKGRDHALACIRMKPRLSLVDIQLPVSLSELRAFLGARTFKKLNAREFVDGQFRTLCVHLDREAIALTAETLRKMIEADVIALP